MKLNWGTGIVIFYIIFIATLLIFVIKSTQYDHSLVVDNYYEEDLRYQAHYDKLLNSRQLEKDLQIHLNQDRKEVHIIFPQNLRGIAGEIRFMRPSDQSKDFSLGIDLNSENEQKLSAKALAAGLWKLQVDWRADGRAYFSEQVLVL